MRAPTRPRSDKNPGVPGQHAVFLGGPGVRYEERPPPPQLAPWVAVCWRIVTDVDFDLRIPPDGCMDMIRGDVVGSFSSVGIARLPAGSISRGVRFHPGGLPALCGVPATELVDLRLPIGDVLPRFRSLERLALDAAPPDPLVRAVWASRDVRDVARDSGYSARQLRRRVLAATGHSPKRLMRIARMQRLLSTAAARAGRVPPSSTATTTRRTWQTTCASSSAPRLTRWSEMTVFSKCRGMRPS